MYALPDGILSYVFVDTSVLYSVLTGLFLIPCWIAALLFLFRLWQDDVWDEYQDCILQLLEMGYSCPVRSIWPRWCFVHGANKFVILTFPWGNRAYIIIQGKKRYISMHTEEWLEIIDSLVREESISMLQNS